MPVYGEIPADSVIQKQPLQGNVSQNSQAPVVESEPAIAVASSQQTHVIPPVTFVPHDQLHNEKLPVPAAEDDAHQPRPTYQAYAPVVNTQNPDLQHNRVLIQDSQGQTSYQPYSHDSPPRQESKPVCNTQGDETSQPPAAYRPYAPISQAQPIPVQVSENPPQIPSKVLSPPQSIAPTLPDVQPSQYQTSATVSNPPLPPQEPCPVILRNQTPPASYLQQIEYGHHTPMPAPTPVPVVSPGKISVQAVSPQTPKVPHIVDYQGPSRVCSGRKAVLTKYTKFYIPTNDLVPRVDPSIQELSCAICEGCFLTNIALHPSFPANFEVFVSPDLAKSGTDDAPVPISRAACQFGLFPTVKNVYRDKCLSEGSIYPVINTMREFNALPSCPGNEVMNGGEYYTSPAIPHSTFCTQCFEAHLKPSTFASQFTMKLTGPGQQWQCDNGRDPAYSSRIVEKYLYSQPQDFAAFSKAFNEKTEISPCPGFDKPLLAGPDGKVHVYTIKGTNNTICMECFYDRVRLTTLEQCFTAISHDPAESTTTCDLASGISRFLFTAAFEAQNLQIWDKGLQTFNRIPKCEGVKGVEEETVEKQATEFLEEANWYSLTQYPNIAACPCCFHSVISPLGGAHLFAPISRQLRAGIVRTCNFSVGNGGITSTNPDDFPYTLYFRGFILRHLLEIGWESKQSDYAPFLSIAKSLSACAPACGSNLRGYKRPSGRRWYGRVATNASDDNDCTIVMCQECYEDNVKDTILATHLGRDLTEAVYAGDLENKKEAFCGPFSKRSKASLREAKEKGDWTIFARHWNLRQRIRDSTLPLINTLQAEFAIQNAKKMTAMTNSLTLQGSAMLSEAAGTDGLNHGNSVVGYGYQSSAGVTAAMWNRDADNTQWGDASNYAKIAMLEAQWKEVE
ncbi:hypothetical protein BJ875DRAFT_451547 [Amylocarpus encephaloides]|uniref:Integral membrane protein n=1 Tax=Amylocarpus encephaloides TaxID=45428 RepID=A0A9P8C9B0_9HELO|nr:hypothetical protein BJ875DRAFT_451547 [Amylocarpus encephaloides]